MSERWAHASVPNQFTVIDYIKSQVKWDEAVAQVGHKFIPDLRVPGLTFDSVGIASELYFMYRMLGAVSWQSRDSLSTYGMSLSCNPDHPKEQWKLGSFGHPRYRVDTDYDYYKTVSSDKDNRVKGDYLDSLGFRDFLPEVKTMPALMGLFSRFKVPVVRVTARTINGSLSFPTQHGDGSIHTDDPPFEVLRLNLSITTNGDYGLQYGNNQPMFYRAGGHMVVNTDVPHRAFIARQNDFLRTNLIIGLVPWLNYDARSDEWSLNNCFGQMHPYDMVANGLVFN